MIVIGTFEIAEVSATTVCFLRYIGFDDKRIAPSNHQSLKILAHR